MSSFTLPQRLEIVQLFYQNSRSFVGVQRAYRAKYGRHSAPSVLSIRRIIDKLESEFTLLDRDRKPRNQDMSEDDDDDDDEDDDDEEEEEEEHNLAPPPKKGKMEKEAKQNGVATNGKPAQKQNDQQKKQKGAPQEQPKKEKKEQQPQKQGKKTLAGGVVIEDLNTGKGPEATAGKRVTVYYVGRLQKNNKVFDSSQSGEGFKFHLGKSEVIRGWDVGVVGMRVGGKRRIVCPPNTAYGSKGAPPTIPGNATLVFDVTLRSIN